MLNHIEIPLHGVDEACYLDAFNLEDGWQDKKVGMAFSPSSLCYDV